MTSSIIHTARLSTFHSSLHGSACLVVMGRQANGRLTPLARYMPSMARSLASSTSKPDSDEGKLADEVPFKKYSESVQQLKHFNMETEKPVDYTLPHPIWSEKEVFSVKISHRKPEGAMDRAAYISVMTMRTAFDLVSGYTLKNKLGTLDERAVLARVIFLETVAGVPGFAAAMIRHLHSLRKMTRDHGWIHTLLEEAENERMHLLTFMSLRRPGPMFRMAVITTQFVGYLEEQAVVTYTDILTKLDKGQLPMWKNMDAPPIAMSYWKLPPDSKMREVILAVRADEAHHRKVNHTLGDLDLKADNPFKPGE